MEKREIFRCNLTVQNGKFKQIIKDVVYKHTDGYYSNRRELKMYGIQDRVLVLDVEVIASLGFEAVPGGFTELTKSDETRNEITGDYE